MKNGWPSQKLPVTQRIYIQCIYALLTPTT